MKRDQLAINSVSTRQADLVECLDAYTEAGFGNVEFMLSHVKEYLEAIHSPEDVRLLLDERKLRCVGGFECAVSCFAPKPAREDNHARLVENARLLAALGAQGMVVGTDGPEDAGAEPDPLGRTADVMRDVADRVADTGITLLIEFNWGPVVKSLRSAAEVARRSARPNVRVVFDPAHYHCTPTKRDQINAESVPYIRHVHVDDMRDKPGELANCNADRVLPGEGCLDLRDLFGALEQHGYDAYFAIELFNAELWSLPAAEAAKRMYDSLLPLCDD